MTQFGELDDLQLDLLDEYPDGDVSILGVNEYHPDGGYEIGNDTITDGRDLPWLQETVDELVWDVWGVTYRDVVILDDQNRFFAAYNLTDNSLQLPQNQAALMDLFRDAAATLP